MNLSQLRRLPVLCTLFSLSMAIAQQPAPATPPIAGIWLGTLTAGPQTLRLQLRVRPTLNGAFECFLDSVDQKSFNIPCDGPRIKGTSVHFDVPKVEGAWAGRLSADGNILTGVWTQGTDFPLIFKKQTTAIEAPKPVAVKFDPAKPPVPVAEIQSVLDADLAEALKSGVLAPDTNAGITIGVVQHGVQRIFSYGTAKPDSVFEIGSVSKTFTALLLAQMAEQQKVRLDEPVRDLLPPGTVAKPASGKEIALVDLSDQHSGLPRLPSNLKPANPTNPYADYDANLLNAFLAKQGVALPADAPFTYSNLGVGLLGYALSLRAGVPYPQLLQDQITGPLGLHDTTVILTPSMQDRFIPGHTAAHAVAPAWDFDALAGCGGIRSTAADMLTYLQAQLHPNQIPAAALDSPAGKTLIAAIGLTHVIHAEAGPGNHIALNWFHNDGTGSFWHNGATGGYTAYVAFNPEQDFALVVLSNTSLDANTFTDRLGQHIAQRLEGHAAFSLAPEERQRLSPPK